METRAVCSPVSRASSAEPPFAIGVFRDRALAKQAIDELRHAGFREDQVWLLYTEQVIIEKRPVVAEELTVSKRNIQEIRRYIDTVRREEARLEREGNVTIRGDRVEEAAPQDSNDTG